MQIQVSRPSQAGEIHRDLATVASRSGSGDLTALELEVHPQGVPSVQQALSTHSISGTLPVNPPVEPIKLSFDVSLTEHLFGTDAQLGVDLSPLLEQDKTKAKEPKGTKTGSPTTRRVVEGALGGAAASALLMSLKSTSRAISNPALATVALTLLGAVSWPYMSEAELSMKPDGSVTAKIGFKKG